MPSYTDEQKRRAVEAVEECGGSVTRAMRRLGYPTRQTLYHWLNRRDASRERRAGRPWSHYDPALKAQAVAFVRSVMAGKDVAEMLGVFISQPVSALKASAISWNGLVMPAPQ